MLERIAILEIKTKRPACRAAIADVARELKHLKSVVAGFEPLSIVAQAKWDALRTTNERLWDIEDAMSLQSVMRIRVKADAMRCEHRDLILTRSADDHKRVRPFKPMVGVVKSLAR